MSDTASQRNRQTQAPDVAALEAIIREMRNPNPTSTTVSAGRMLRTFADAIDRDVLKKFEK